MARPQSARQARPKPAAKPAAKRPSGSARPKPAAKRPSGSARPKPVARRKAGQQSFLSSLLSIFGHIETKKARTATASGRQLGLGVVGAADNAARMGYSFYQRQVKKRPKADPSSGVVGERLDRLVDTGYRAFGAKPPSKMTQPERGRDQFRRALTTNLLLTPVTPQFGFLRGVPTIQLGAQFAANEILSNYLDDQTGGNIINTINSAWGLKLPGAVDVGSDDMIDAANKSLLPNSALSLTAGSALGLTPKVLDAGARAGANRFRNIRRNIRAGRAVQQETAERARQQAAGLTRETEGGIVFTPEAQQPPPPLDMEEWVQGFKARERERNAAAAGATPQPQPRQIPTIDATAETFGKAQPAPLPSANPPKDPWMDDEQYQAWLRQNALAEAWLRQNASAEIVPVAPPAARPPAELPRQPLPPQDDLRGEGLADPWGMGPDPNSPVQQELGRKAGAAPPSRSEQAADPEVEIEVDPEVDPDGFPVYSPDLPESTA
ncbi:MAG: hypothetical protein FJ083_11120, partial [Cyanobacteria bacterium K_Offshore_surface_m2_239]|nr:hypothetical protein [Cyanobacteria bacterium K_Offshore_surface_m2_239]